MSRLNELIFQLCPNGVIFQDFENVCEYVRGVVYEKGQELKSNENAWKLLRANNIDLKTSSINFDDVKYISNDVKVKEGQILRANDILICAGSGSRSHIGKIAYIYNDTDYTFGGFMAVIRASHKLNSRFLFHILSGTSFSKHLDVNLNTSTINNLSSSVLRKFRIPIPPLEIQREIARILDNFTELTAVLTAELAARKQQFDYYLEHLLDFKNDVQIKTLGDVFSTVTDYVAAGSFADIAKNVTYKTEPDFAQLVRTMDIKSSFTKGSNVYVDEVAFKFLHRVNLDKDSIIMPNIGINCGEVYYVTPLDLPYTNNVLGPNAILLRSKAYNNKFLFYLLKSNSFQKKLKMIISPGGQTKFNKTELRKLELPIPRLEDQQRIVDILDKFDKLVNDISEGLPAEIAARQKQYEYYRDKLLTFKEVGNESI